MRVFKTIVQMSSMQDHTAGVTGWRLLWRGVREKLGYRDDASKSKYVHVMFEY